MKKILIVNNNLDMGGIQKSLINLLREIHNEYEITLLLFSKSGALIDEIPKNVKIITPRKAYRMLGLTRAELSKYPFIFLLKAFLIKYSALFSRRSAMKILGIFQKKIKGYDVVFSFSHLTNSKHFDNGCGDFVLDKTVSPKKVCMIHCDYLNSGLMTEQNNEEYAEFDAIACCSDSVKERFLLGSGVEQSKVYTLRNFYDLKIIDLANDSMYDYDKKYINLVTVARLSKEKGIERVLESLAKCQRKDIRYYVIGNGPLKNLLEEKISVLNLKEQVFLLGEQKNPYRHMHNADYLLVPSLHEAAPIVFDEANILRLPIISTATTSAIEMVDSESGIVCENSQEGIESAIFGLTKSIRKEDYLISNTLQVKQFEKIVKN